MALMRDDVKLLLFSLLTTKPRFDVKINNNIDDNDDDDGDDNDNNDDDNDDDYDDDDNDNDDDYDRNHNYYGGIIQICDPNSRRNEEYPKLCK